MSHRIGRVAHIVRDVVSDTIMNRLSDPRISRFTSVTRVEVSPDLKFADVHLSVMGDEAQGHVTMQGLQSARGVIQSQLARQLAMRQCPTLRLHLDRGLKKAAEIIEIIDRSMAEAAERNNPHESDTPEELAPKDSAPRKRAIGDAT